MLAKQALLPLDPLSQQIVLFIFLSFFWWYWGLNSGLHGCCTGTLLCEQHLQPEIVLNS
jgi:hypothetical protein